MFMNRFFKIGARTVKFPIPTGTLEDNCKQMMINFPVFRWTEILESDGVPQEDGSVLYTLLVPPVKANG
jgi:hypothetical protein